MLSWTSESSDYPSPHGASYSRQTNGHVPEKLKLSKSQTGFRRIPIREVKQATQTALDAISRTVKVARSIFQDDSSQRSMIGIVLEYIQSDSPDPSAYSKTLPSELQLTTQTLLMTLPSSTHFLLLPPNLRFYKPYVDLASSSSFVPQAQFAQKLDEWFLKSTKNLQTAVQRWFSDLQSVKEVWNIRSSIWKWISSSSGLGAQETARLKSIFDDVCHKRVIGIWKLALVDAEKAFRDQLSSAASGLREGLNTPHTGMLGMFGLSIY
jgi:conserved oligomeric Golgi complex subunit 1